MQKILAGPSEKNRTSFWVLAFRDKREIPEREQREYFKSHNSIIQSSIFRGRALLHGLEP